MSWTCYAVSGTSGDPLAARCAGNDRPHGGIYLYSVVTSARPAPTQVPGRVTDLPPAAVTSPCRRHRLPQPSLSLPAVDLRCVSGVCHTFVYGLMSGVRSARATGRLRARAPPSPARGAAAHTRAAHPHPLRRPCHPSAPPRPAYIVILRAVMCHQYNTDLVSVLVSAGCGVNLTPRSGVIADWARQLCPLFSAR